MDNIIFQKLVEDMTMLTSMSFATYSTTLQAALLLPFYFPTAPSKSITDILQACLHRPFRAGISVPDG